MKPAPFRYHRPSGVDEALALLAQHGADAKPLAGGQSLVPAMNFRLTQPAVLVDLNDVASLGGIVPADDGGLVVGAMTRQRAVEISPLVAERAPLLAETMPFIAHPQIRNRGTVGGSLAHADPAAELPAVMVVSNARLCARSAAGERWIPAREFFVGLFATALEPGELLVEMALPAMGPRSGWAFEEVARRHGDYALVGVAVRVGLDATGRCADARIALMSVGEGPVVATRASAVLVGEEPAAAVIRASAEAAATEDIDPPADIHATAAYRRQLARVLLRRALERAFRRCGGSEGHA